MGIGLSVVKTIVTTHGWKIDVKDYSTAEKMGLLAYETEEYDAEAEQSGQAAAKQEEEKELTAEEGAEEEATKAEAADNTEAAPREE